MVGSLVATVEEVRRVAQLSNNSEITDGEVASFIEDAWQEVRGEYGDPLSKTFTYIRFSGTGSTNYDFTGDDRPVYRLDFVEVDGTINVPTGSYTANLDLGEIDFNSTFLSDFDGERLDFEYVPMQYHLLVKYLAAKYLLETTTKISGENVRHPRIAGLKMRVERIEGQISPQGAISSGEFANWDPRRGRHVTQDFEGTF